MREKFVTFVFIVVFVVLIARLFYWQIIRADDLAEIARFQYQHGRSIMAPRGNVLASDGSWLAGKIQGWLLYASIPKLTEDKNSIADKIAPFTVEIPQSDEEVDTKKLLLAEAGRIKTLLNREDVVWIPIKKRLGNDAKKNIQALSIEGIGFEFEEIRSYPEASSAAHLLGFVGKNKDGADQGYFGLEGHYDMVLLGKSGYVVGDVDAAGVPIFLGDQYQISAVEGVNLITHIDKGLQIMLDDKLLEGIEKYGASAGSAIIMDPGSGAIVAMSSYPNYDPSDYWKYSDALFKNPIISDSFEPGSIFKIIVMASALDADVLEPDTECDICTGPIIIGEYSISTWNNQYFPDSIMTDVIVHSDNVGMVFVGKSLGVERFYDYLERFGIGERTGIDLQGEVSPSIRVKSKWGQIDLATASFGQGVAITPIKMIQAVSAIANKGIMMKPQVVDKLTFGNFEEDIKQEEVRRVISQKAAEKITYMMVEAAKYGEAKWTHLKGFDIAGKTGTAQIPIKGHYDEEKTIASYVGFAPSSDPKFIMLITLREPSSSPWASETAAPLWYEIAKDLFMHYGIQPER